ncbi:MAG: hypothetical protein A3I07_03250 [Candidatus Doudnabacteria bacterium RIFCSPLOWO2_02_FULL_42_9]|uniref:Uncharacterized protein n=1 Tax=Candidatus Doudnabacteria bacterium RIFCSPHIGHO2_01_FULL_41_86 TaxID=1817821 RepID=A0A1F5N7Y8_9BACT|nr:MAG: hypothetical protein A2717_04005 [Candidatus Doudnabacteria bacterium RIFCSPHIGHO2_01_FULL_41_86]OGE74916.1 MAG: hypothetical protein A3K07_02355 [Candidatus Doudnabacteria bacterium RIFCSPHIGHO2_01_43_10]OGE85797.1 MAG: hypothetical protein A3E28_03345 [Candidatus Doudnabacteria bacterium RIFCSPHIGHO2_12_FULL_42_22]OGE87292.1 MAG: hypothetical protein A3C49_00970 [Candidatus Doudnabacteria bacterium RIFCSPHIGHO2_02_FULL_42_25]OGE92129.1 MAG: hypothetical protein A2895_00845 [Candidatus
MKLAVKFSDIQIAKIADIAANIGLIFFAAVVLPGIFDKFRPWFALMGLFIALIFWTFSLILLTRRTKYD